MLPNCSMIHCNMANKMSYKWAYLVTQTWGITNNNHLFFSLCSMQTRTVVKLKTIHWRGSSCLFHIELLQHALNIHIFAMLNWDWKIIVTANYPIWWSFTQSDELWTIISKRTNSCISRSTEMIIDLKWCMFNLIDNEQNTRQADSSSSPIPFHMELC